MSAPGKFDHLINGAHQSTLDMAAHSLAVVCAEAQRGDFFAAGYNLACVANIKMDEGYEVNGRRHELVQALQEAIRVLALGSVAAVDAAVSDDARLWSRGNDARWSVHAVKH